MYVLLSTIKGPTRQNVDIQIVDIKLCLDITNCPALPCPNSCGMGGHFALTEGGCQAGSEEVDIFIHFVDILKDGN
jgi:hypothetical protein